MALDCTYKITSALYLEWIFLELLDSTTTNIWNQVKYEIFTHSGDAHNSQYKGTIAAFVSSFQNFFVGAIFSVELQLGVADVCFFLMMRCFNDAMFSNS